MTNYIASFSLPVIIKQDGEDDTDFEPENLSDEDRIDLIKRTADSFNDDSVDQYFGDDMDNPEVKMNAYYDEDLLIVDAYITDNSPEYIEKIRDFLSGQCSDGWGEGFEQQPQEIDGIDYYISTWDVDKYVQFIGVEEEKDDTE
jgi:hypothetical protein